MSAGVQQHNDDKGQNVLRPVAVYVDESKEMSFLCKTTRAQRSVA